MEDILKALIGFFPLYKTLNPARQRALLELAALLGTERFDEMRPVFDCVNRKDYRAAAAAICEFPFDAMDLASSAVLMRDGAFPPETEVVETLPEVGVFASPVVDFPAPEPDETKESEPEGGE